MFISILMDSNLQNINITKLKLKLNAGELHVYGNYFDGTLPKEVGLLKNLGKLSIQYKHTEWTLIFMLSSIYLF